MDSRSYDSRQELKKAFWGFVSLLGSSVVSAIGFIIIAANRLIPFDPACGVFIILFVQWQTLGLTIAKTGIEQVVFAIVTENEGVYLNPASYIYRKALPLSVIFSLAVLLVFSPLAACVAFCTILLDTYTLIVVADLNARKRFRATALSNLLNYPLFFVVIFTVNYFGKLTVDITLFAFLLSSFVRWLWAKNSQVIHAGMHEVTCKANVQMGIQQGLNYFLFRADQIVLALMGLTTQDSKSLTMYVFLAKFPEFVSAVMVILATVFARKLYIQFPIGYLSAVSMVKRHFMLIMVHAASISASFYCYLKLWKGGDIPYQLAVPFLINAAFLLPVINVIFSNLRQGHLKTLIRNYAIASCVGLMLSMHVCFNLNLVALSWLVPLQFAVFIGISFVLGWGSPKKLYEYRSMASPSSPEM